MKLSEAFDNAKRNARPDCPKCKGTGSFMYDHNHRTVCDLCCIHNMGWWKLEKNYGDDNGKWCCKAGCGLKLAEQPQPRHISASMNIKDPKDIAKIKG